MKYIAKPFLNRDKNMKEFDDIKKAIQYLEQVTGYQMSFTVNKKTKEKTYDWELVGKLIRVDNSA